MESKYKPSSGSEPQSRITLVVAISYALMILAMWGSFAFSSGMGYETGFAWNSQNMKYAFITEGMDNPESGI